MNKTQYEIYSYTERSFIHEALTLSMHIIPDEGKKNVPAYSCRESDLKTVTISITIPKEIYSIATVCVFLFYITLTFSPVYINILF